MSRVNCQNCGAASWSKGRCDYCWSPDSDPRWAHDLEAISLGYYNGFIDETQRAELQEALLGLRAGDAVVVPMNARIERIDVDQLIDERNHYLAQRELKFMGY
jgi:hypothetical protein